jgi:hypothetical protein
MPPGGKPRPENGRQEGSRRRNVDRDHAAIMAFAQTLDAAEIQVAHPTFRRQGEACRW